MGEVGRGRRGRHPRLTATVLDLPGSAAIGREIISSAGMADRARHRDDDMTKDDLGSGYDAVLCFNLLHHLTPAQIVALFAKIREAVAPGGTVAIMDAFADAPQPTPETAGGAQAPSGAAWSGRATTLP